MANFVHVRGSRCLSRCGYLTAVLAVFVALSGFRLAAADEAPAEQSQAEQARLKQWKEGGWGLMKEFCIDCHSGESAYAGLDLDGFETLD